MQSFTSFTSKCRFCPALLSAALLLAAGAADDARAGGPSLPDGDRRAAGRLRKLVPVPVSVTQDRRDRLVEMLRPRLDEGRRGVVLISGARGSDEDEFRQKSSFYYLTGLESPGADLVILFDKGECRERLYLPERSLSTDRWQGPVLGPAKGGSGSEDPQAWREQARALTGFTGREGCSGDVRDWEGLRGDLAREGEKPAKVFYENFDTNSMDQETRRLHFFLDSEMIGRDSRKLTRAEELGGVLGEMRRVKSPTEIDAIREASRITCDAQRAAMRAMRPGLMEYVIEAAIEHEFTRQGARHPAFPTVVGAGSNACIMHYSRNDSTIEPGDLVLIDAGAEFGRYAADVTRTIPASGRFEGEQKRLYQAVLDAQLAGLALARPGSAMRQINETVMGVLKRRGLAAHAVHGCCHYVGLDVHDAGERDSLLEPGVVLTVEPGVYMPDAGVGVRIEDTVLITENGHEVLSACAPKEISEVEAEMAKAGPGLRSDGSAARPR